LRAAFTKAKHLDRPASLVALDLDRFKAVNDTAGHAAGDVVLCKVTDACREAVCSSDTVAGLGGDEFVLILEHCAAAERAERIAGYLLKALNPITVAHAGVAHLIHASLGLARMSAHYNDEKAWLEAADQACLTAKREGRSQLRLALPVQREIPAS
jgi:diguanylate cyclase (GGDEF)-like protein